MDERSSAAAADQERPLPELAEFYEEFLKDRMTDLAELQRSFNSGNLQNVKAIAHRWKGFCAPYGFGTLGALAAELETCALDGAVEECGRHISAAAAYLARKQGQT
jgi:HPt (histidine-containing phosphotransfer) domain-containing protein